MEPSNAQISVLTEELITQIREGYDKFFPLLENIIHKVDAVSDRVTLIENKLHNIPYYVYAKNTSSKAFKLFVTSNTRIEEVKTQIYSKGGLSPDQQRLIYAGKQLEDDRTLFNYGVKPESTIHIVGRLRGN